jgi:hypothetical protein
MLNSVYREMKLDGIIEPEVNIHGIGLFLLFLVKFVEKCFRLFEYLLHLLNKLDFPQSG